MHYPCTRVGSIVCTNDGMMNQILTWLTAICYRAITKLEIFLRFLANVKGYFVFMSNLFD